MCGHLGQDGENLRARLGLSLEGSKVLVDAVLGLRRFEQRTRVGLQLALLEALADLLIGH